MAFIQHSAVTKNKITNSQSVNKKAKKFIFWSSKYLGFVTNLLNDLHNINQFRFEMTITAIYAYLGKMLCWRKWFKFKLKA